MIYIIASQVCVSRSGLDFDNALAYLQNRNIERAAAEVVDRDRFVLLLIQAIGKGRRRRLINNSQHFEPCNFAGLLSCLPLAIVEISRYVDNSPADLFAQEIFGSRLHFLQVHRGNLRWVISLSEI